MKHDPSITDAQRNAFLLKLTTSDQLVDDWEKRFLGSFMAGCTSGPSLNWFTPGRRASAEAMWRKYGAELNHPFPLLAAKIDCLAIAAELDGCEYFIKLDGVQQHCNEPAKWVNKLGFRYCETHGEAVQRDIRRRGGHMELRVFVPKSAIENRQSKTA